jgi:RNA polymerase primary sigma factor
MNNEQESVLDSGQPVVSEVSDFDVPGSEEELDSTERTALRSYLQAIGKTPLLTIEEEVELAGRIQKGDQDAQRHMVQANLRLVVKIARDYENFGLPLMDLISEGNLGLIKAVERFDPAKGGKLSTYAAWWIKQSIKRSLASHGKTIRLPVHLVDRIARMRRVINQLSEELHREPTNEEIALIMELPINKIAHLKSISTRPASLEAPVGEDGDTSFGDLIGDENQATPFESLRGKTALDDIQEMINQLDPREAEIIQLRFGLDGDRPLTLEEVGEKFKLTRERVRQLQHLALMHLRRMMSDHERQRSSEEVREESLAQARAEVFGEFFKRQMEKTAKKSAAPSVLIVEESEKKPSKPSRRG